MKSYTNTEQSEKLAKILPTDSADMWWADGIVIARSSVEEPDDIKSVLPIWSLAALLNYIVVNLHVGVMLNDGRWELNGKGLIFCNEDLIDACYEMIIHLHEQKLL